MKHKFTATILVVFLTCYYSSAAAAGDYYVDASKGNDTNSGRSPDAAWRTLGALNRAILKPGDKVLFAAGSRYTGQLAPRGSGDKKAPITLDVYGGSQKARIVGQGEVEAPLLLRNVEYWNVGNLELTNDDPAANLRRYGVLIQAENCGTMHGIHLKDLFI